MPVNSKIERIHEEGEEREAFVVTFTNGAREQLDELKKHFEQANELELVKLAISLLVNIKEDREKTKKLAP